PIENGRFAGGPVTVLTVPAGELDALPSLGKLYLTDEQKEQLLEDAGVAPSFLWIFDLRKGENECTCNAANRGLRISEDQVEVPHEYLMSDEDVEKMLDSLEN
ncbi:MAG: hypothetical protein GWM98_24475, partial [Nitrospinaceae bacterium]|nr:hypothetical protein [Nitrospinaceae bacterium]NIY17797.1 hypothetical protein [Nitrospinaceae bacterium]